MRLRRVVVMISVGVFSLISVSAWGMIASHPGNMKWYHTQGEELIISFGASMDVESGNMIYAIQGPEGGGWASELEWPLDGIVYMGGMVSASLWGKLQINGGYWRGLSDDAGTMKDSDWIYARYGNERAIYSESKATMTEATHIDINSRYDFLTLGDIAIGGILGYSYTKWNWEAGDGYQTSIDPYRYYVGPIVGTAIIYEEKIKVPYLGLSFSLSPSSSPFGMNIYALYSPKAQCDDVDDHVLRFKEAIGKTEGTFFSVGGSLLWNFIGSWSVTGKMNYTKYDLEGKHDQYGYGGSLLGWSATDIDLTIEGSQFSLGAMVSYDL